MAGNEKLVVNFLIEKINQIKINHLDLVTKIQNPIQNGQLTDITSSQSISTANATKKADLFINGFGVSIKQSGSSFLYNRLQRAELLKVFKNLHLSDPQKSLKKMDELINNFHDGNFDCRDRHWSEGFTERDFLLLLEFLMMQGSPNKGKSKFPAQFILTAPSKNLSEDNISCLTFDEYFKKYKENIYLSLRRQWIGQKSKTEHQRALSISKKPENSSWVFNSIQGEPDAWRTQEEFPIEKRRTVYMISIQVIPH